MFERLTADTPIVVRNPDAIRPWQHVLEPLSGYLQLGARLLDGDRAAASAWNFGPDVASGERSVRWVVERCLNPGAQEPGSRRLMPARSPTRRIA